MYDDRTVANSTHAEVPVVAKSQSPSEQTSIDAEVDAEVLRTVPKAFVIDSEHAANWLVRKVSECRAYAARVKEFADAELRRAEREEKTLLFLFGRQIEAWAREEVKKFGGRRKSLALPAGCVGFRRIASSLQIEDEQAVLEWARTHCPTAVVINERLSRTVLKTRFEETGEIPDKGVRLEPEGERFFIR